MGGLAAAWAIRHGENTAFVRRFVTIATPWRGTRLAVFDVPHIPYEIRYGASILDDLVAPGVPTTTLWGDDDPIVVPATSAAADGTVTCAVHGGGHHELLLSGRVYRAISAVLDAA